MYDEVFSELVNSRVREVRPHVHRAVEEAQAFIPNGKVFMSDAFSGCRYVSKVLFRTHDFDFVEQVAPEVMYRLLVEGTVGAARYRLEKHSQVEGAGAS